MIFWRRHRPLRVLALLARHGTAKYADALPALRELLDDRLPGVAAEILVVDNSLERSVSRRLAAGVEMIGASNEAWEFSAWDDGVRHVGRRLLRHDFVALVTSAFREYAPIHLGRLSEPMLASMGGRRAALGHVDCFHEQVEALGMPLQAWLRSSFVLLPPRELRRLGTTVAVTPRTPLFSGDPTAPFRGDAPLSSPYRRLITDWLTGGGTGQGVTWHSRFDLGAGSFAYFEAKARAILNEQLLTARLARQGCMPVDLTWLADAVEAVAVPDVVPDWQAQVAPRLGAVIGPRTGS